MKEVLIVGEDDARVAATTDCVRDAGYAVRSARHAGAALSETGASLPDLVMIEAELPGLDGLQLTRVLKADARTKPLPVIVVSADDREAEALAAGAAAFLRRPIQPLQLEALLRALIGRP